MHFTKIILTTLVLSSLASSTLADNRIFGVVELGTTPLSTYVNALKKEQCKVEYQPKSHFAVVDYRCYGLPGNGVVTAVAKNDGKIFSMTVFFQKDFHGTAFNSYLSALRKNYGLATQSVIPFVGNKLVKFKSGAMTITLKEEHMSRVGTVSYDLTEDLKMYDKRQREAEAKKQKTTESLL